MYAPRYAQLFCAIVLVGCIELEEETSCTVMATLFIGGEWFHGVPSLRSNHYPLMPAILIWVSIYTYTYIKVERNNNTSAMPHMYVLP
jgi:hypothetical protein